MLFFHSEEAVKLATGISLRLDSRPPAASQGNSHIFGERLNGSVHCFHGHCCVAVCAYLTNFLSLTSRFIWTDSPVTVQYIISNALCYKTLLHHRGAIRLPHTSHSGLKDRTLGEHFHVHPSTVRRIIVQQAIIMYIL
ncbi:hypothetical protein DPEC_G00237900 [Dallia pectoralis]|uniref:Uncharacterized protein n=1 Tax=Dallia pectoralis TaxID=75939 RepID=A0ACC2FYV9_DALPE|nr:hypothetical protein DPEC_G00237900 [Dallia pectoralis]